jgi:CheY-like chemotaxis protein
MGQVLNFIRLAPENDQSDRHNPISSDRKGNGHPIIPTILVVEDEVLVRLAVSDFVRECGYRVLEAASGEEAQSIFRSGEPIEIVFSDIDLGPGLNGFGLARWVREEYPSVRILLTSGAARMSADVEQLCDGPMLNKPYSFQSLTDEIKRLLEAFGRRTG